MASEVYSVTTAPNPKSSWFQVPSERLDKRRFVVKVIEVIFSFVAFILEEVVSSCNSCFALYFFEFVSCTAFLFTLLLLVLLSTTLHARVGVACWASLDFWYTSLIAFLFLVSSIIFAADNNGTNLEKSAVVFGFMAMSAFFVDLFFFYRTSGFPFQKPQSGGGSPAGGEPQVETEKLNAAE
ncbi:CKLF-like MARVEL transmembrane domain-containing protein 6 [Hippoglossus hippoglossus]|uniref:CKLF-like MARVEL transmembrane domain-containing protein 6 n=1 Tax=Hippoglossus hippoglossus TaxID=8267 RepID=UPI00148E114C|nr:CKLF-like MARVEL transmembrane domain-containing protein 6 [Hippoglossus hippoglossus]XP_034466656.1 CKLF-like MARVEL transmembrane domain-containing protein 6 [Hippoglossus hippoglossus]XP_035019736.1 CKLF-like MARVEL transmembrane domain-containing protein 6 [Hippoglossus stenolepis]XP_035019737.1 CKLF-like MARVEL transmembrane domain-containing protein 6 [Hippoglossus stenolepis]